ncbi:unnamed protein product, partial [Mesorhabditis belari]|uniref:Uncharacterized protein n=1 Tax=Mesorhabditis belari TaxID=2138241 RepID=A0AAF3JB70_9BILA
MDLMDAIKFHASDLHVDRLSNLQDFEKMIGEVEEVNKMQKLHIEEYDIENQGWGPKRDFCRESSCGHGHIVYRNRCASSSMASIPFSVSLEFHTIRDDTQIFAIEFDDKNLFYILAAELQ